MKKRRLNRRIIILSAALIVLLSTLVYLGGYLRYADRFLPHTSINGIDVSGLTLAQANEKLAELKPEFTVIQLDKDGNDLQQKLDLTDIDANIRYDASQLLSQQKPYLWFLSQNREETCTKLRGIYTGDRINRLLDTLYCLQKENVTPTQDAHVEVINGEVQIVNSKLGTSISKEKVYALIAPLIEEAFTQESVNSFSLLDQYDQPGLASDDPALIRQKEELTGLIERSLSIDLGNDTRTLNAQDIAAFIKSDSSGFTVDEESLSAYINQLGSLYNSATVYLDKTALKNDLSKALLDPEVSYVKAGWIEEELTRLIEVYIQEQTLYYYENGELVLTSPVVTGNGDLTDATPAGTFRITKMSTDSTLSGADYSEHVDYWIGFDETGRIYGLHDASWRDEFGGDIWLSDPSRGCVNMPTDKIAQLFQMVELGVEIKIYA